MAMTPQEIDALISAAPKTTEEMLANRRAFLDREAAEMRAVLDTMRSSGEMILNSVTPGGRRFILAGRAVPWELIREMHRTGMLEQHGAYYRLPRPVTPQSPAERLARAILRRMREIDSHITCADDSKSRPPEGDDYNLLWDAVLDEIRAETPEVDTDQALWRVGTP